jgi:hypothetical protein
MGIKEACMHAHPVTHRGFIRGFLLPAQVDWDEQRIRKIEEKKTFPLATVRLFARSQ